MIPNTPKLLSRFKRTALGCFFYLVFFAIVPNVTSAQTSVTGALAGTVTDSAGLAIPNAQMTLTRLATSEKRSVVSDAEGRYRFALLAPGTYSLQSSATGFKTGAQSGVQIAVTETASLDVHLAVGEVSQVISVEADQQLVQTDSSALGRAVTSEQVTALPLVNRNYTQIVGLSPGVTTPVENASDLGKGSSSSSGGAAGAKVVNGARPSDNNFQLDGVPVNDNLGVGGGSALGISDVGGGLPVPNPDTIQEFKVQTGEYDASFGRNAGANVNLITKAGTNHFHGTVFEFIRNNDLNANDYFRKKLGQPRGALKQNQFGFTLGGPILKKNLFFFTSYQGTRQSNGLATGCAAVYSGPALTNDRSAAGIGAVFAGQTGAFGGEAINANGSNINPIALAILNLKLSNGQYFVPTPQSVNNNLPFGARGSSSFSLPCTFNEDQFMTNLQYQQSSRSSFTARFFEANDSQVVTLGQSNVPGVPSPSSGISRDFSLTNTFIVTPHLVNELILGYANNHVVQPQGAAATNQPFSFTSLGANVPTGLGQTIIEVAGSFTAYPQNGFNINQPSLSLVDAISYSRGKHTLRFGGEITRSYISDSNYSTGAVAVFVSFPDFVLGLPGGPVASGGNGSFASNVYQAPGDQGLFDHKYRKWDGAAYIQDDYKVSAALTLNLGFRYDRIGALSDALGRASTFDTSKADPNPPASGSIAGYVVANNFAGTIPTGVTQTGQSYPVNGDGQNHFSPRVGYAWQVFPRSSALVVRGGFGLYTSEPPAIATLTGILAPPFIRPFGAQGTVTNTISFQNPFGAGPFLTPSSLPSFTPYSSAAPLSGLQYQNLSYQPGYVEEFNTNVQSDLGHNLLFELGYVGAHGVHLPRGILPNEANLASPSAPIRGITTNTVANIQQRVPLAGFAPTGLDENNTEGQSWYNGLQASLTKRLSHGLQFLASYTWSKDLDTDAPDVVQASDGTSGDAVGNEHDPHARYGRTNFDRPQRLVVSFTYDFPKLSLGNALARTATNGWQVSGVTTYQSGTALTVRGTNGSNVNGATNDFAPLSGSCGTGAYVASGAVKNKLNSYFNRSCFAFKPNGTTPMYPIVGSDGIATGFGNSGVGTVLGPGQRNWDLSLVKRTAVPRFGESANVEFRSEFFNAFNTPQFANPDTKVSDATFGVITATSVNPRIIQFALKLNF
jgi:hypothetical protein